MNNDSLKKDLIIFFFLKSEAYPVCVRFPVRVFIGKKARVGQIRKTSRR